MATTKIALVTGANKGIGKEVARQLGERGMTVLVGARDEGRGRAAVAELADAGIAARAVHLDVTDEESVAAAAKLIEHEYGRLDVLVNNAGILLDQDKPSTEDFLNLPHQRRRCLLGDNGDAFLATQGILATSGEPVERVGIGEHSR